MDYITIHNLNIKYYEKIQTLHNYCVLYLICCSNFIIKIINLNQLFLHLNLLGDSPTVQRKYFNIFITSAAVDTIATINIWHCFIH